MSLSRIEDAINKRNTHETKETIEHTLLYSYLKSAQLVISCYLLLLPLDMKILSFGVLENRHRNFTAENFHKTFVDQQFKDMKTKRHEQLKDMNMVCFHERVLLIQSIIVCSEGLVYLWVLPLH